MKTLAYALLMLSAGFSLSKLIDSPYRWLIVLVVIVASANWQLAPDIPFTVATVTAALVLLYVGLRPALKWRRLSAPRGKARRPLRVRSVDPRTEDSNMG